jgi:glycerol kinase
MTALQTIAIGLDLGTTSIKAGLLDRDGELNNIINYPAPRINNHDGRYESDALAYATIAEQALSDCMARAVDCRSLGLCSQRSSFLIWEHATGQPITPLISWQDTRGAASCVELQTHGNSIRNMTGLPLTPYYFAPKLRIVLQDHPTWQARLENGNLRVGTLDTFLIWRWSRGRYFVTDASMAARTLLMDIRKQKWSQQLCDLFGISLRILPEIRSSAGLNLQLDNGMVLQASVGDQSAALIASLESGCSEALVNLGTGGFVVRYLSNEQHAMAGYLQTLAYQDSERHTYFVIEGTLNSIAAALAHYPVVGCQIEDLARDDIFCLAEPSGLGAPYFRGDIGIRYSQTVEHLPQRRIAALLLEAIIFRVARILEEFHSEHDIERAYLSGGLSELNCLQQGIALCVPFKLYRLKQNESSLQGAALLAAGMTCNRKSEMISSSGNAQALQKKYLRWKMWIDDLLVSD